MNIVLFIRALSIGGAERQVVAIANGLARKGHSVAIATLYPDGEFEAHVDRSRVRVITVRKGRTSVVGTIRSLRRFIRGQRANVLYSFLPTCNVLAVLCKPLIRPVRVVWGIRSGTIGVSDRSLIDRIISRLEIMLAPFADALIANSNAGRQTYISRGVDSSRIAVVRNGVDCSAFAFSAPGRQRIRSALGLADHHSVIAAVGRVHVVKNLELLLEATAKVMSRHDQSRLLIVGSGERDYISQLQMLARDRGIEDRVLWTGAIEDMQALYSAADIVCSASISEGCSNVLAEARLAGCICVATDVGENGSFISSREFLVPSNDSLSLERALLAALAKLVNVDRRDIKPDFANTCDLPAMLDRTESIVAGVTITTLTS